MPLYVLLFILFYQVFILHRVSFICDCTYEYVCNVSSPATEAEYINNYKIYFHCSSLPVLEVECHLFRTWDVESVARPGT